MTVMLEQLEEKRDIAAAPSAAGQMLMRVLRLLDRERIPHVVLHGFEAYPRAVTGDVDLLVPGDCLPRRLAEILHAHRVHIGARVVQWFEDAAHFIVLAGRDDDGFPVLLQLHVSCNYEMAARVFFSGEEILATRRRHGIFWAPAFAHEFACILANRLCKQELEDRHAERLTALRDLDPGACDAQARRLLPHSADTVIEAAKTNDFSPMRGKLPQLRRELLSSGASRRTGLRPGLLVRKAVRWIRPGNGFHAVFLGPDGVGKSTTIESFSRDLAPAFLEQQYLTFAPGLLPQKFAPPKPGGPHSLPPRPLGASLLKAAWWLVCYTLGYCLTIRPTLARGGLVVNHRYLVDAIVDQKRYRYSGPVWLLRLIWLVAPKPHVVFLLDAAPSVIQKRKQEVTFAETAAQVKAYRRVVAMLSMGRKIDASRPRRLVAAEAEWVVLNAMADRLERRHVARGTP